MNKANNSRRANFRWQWEHNRAAFITWLLLRLSVLAVMIRAAMQGYWENLFICLLVLFLFQLPSVLEKRLRITLPSGLQIIILVHIFEASIESVGQTARPGRATESPPHRSIIIAIKLSMLRNP